MVAVGLGEWVFDEVVVDRDGRRALAGFSAIVPGVGVTAISGPSGSGKSTLLRLFNRLEVPAAGRVLLDGCDLMRMDPLVLRRQVGMVFQRPTPFCGTVADNVRVAVPHADDAEVVAVLKRVGLDGQYAPREATALSGGELQRVCLARTLITAPSVLLLDEPTSALDPAAGQIVEDVIRGLVREGMSVVWVSHDAAQVLRVADRVVQIEGGRCIGMSDVGHGPGPMEVVP